MPCALRLNRRGEKMNADSNNWLAAINALTATGETYVLITLLGTRGSTPRSSGTKMVVSAEQSYGTIGGGHLEYKTIAMARDMLADAERHQHIEHFPLGPALGQCCGGSTSVLFERMAASNVNIMLFGAGHVGKALANILADLPCRVHWVDPRAEQFPAKLADTISAIVSDTPGAEAATMPAQSYYLVMTHNHQLDFEICEAILKRDDFGYLGLIGSETKWRRFQQRFDHRGHPPQAIARIHCPVGLAQIPGKRPMEVAVSIAGEIIEHYQQRQSAPATQQGVHWKDLKQLLSEDYLGAN